MPETTTTIDQVVQALISFEDALTPDMPATMAALSHARVALAKAVNTFVADEGEQVGILRRIGIAGRSEIEQRELFDALIALRLRYSGHISKWTAAEVTRDWSGYRAESVTLIVGMRKILRARTALRSAVASTLQPMPATC